MNDMTKKFFMFVAISLMPVSLFCQTRQNREKLRFDSTSEIITKMTGWAYNRNSGEWVEHENAIGTKSGNLSVFQLGYESAMGGALQHFLSLQTKTFVFRDKKYYCLVVEKYVVYFDNPKGLQGQHTYKKKSGWVFKADEFKKLWTINGLVKVPILFEAFGNSIKVASDAEIETQLLDSIQNRFIENEKGSTSYEKWMLPVLKAKDGEIRFALPLDENGYKFSSPSYFTDEKGTLLGNAYFETDWKTFSKLLIE